MDNKIESILEYLDPALDDLSIEKIDKTLEKVIELCLTKIELKSKKISDKYKNV